MILSYILNFQFVNNYFKNTTLIKKLTDYESLNFIIRILIQNLFRNIIHLVLEYCLSLTINLHY